MINKLFNFTMSSFCIVAIFCAVISIGLIVFGLGEKLTDVLIRIF